MSLNSEAETITPLFAKLDSLIPSLHGWCTIFKAQVLASLVLTIRPETVVEIGVWGGRSLFPMAMALKINKRGKAIGIDPWKADESVKGQGPQDAKWWGEIDHETVLKDFMFHRHKLELDTIIDVARMTSDEAWCPPVIDILHLDGNHGPQALKDVTKFGKVIRLGGFCCLDDLRWSGGAVEGAERWLLENGFIKLYPLGTGALYQRVK